MSSCRIRAIFWLGVFWDSCNSSLFLANRFIETGRSSQAILALSNSVRSNPRDFQSYYHLALLHELMHVPSLARTFYQKAIRIRPYDPQLRTALGEASLERNDIQGAMECFLVAESMGDVSGGCSRRLGQLYEREGNEEKAAYFYRRYLMKRHFVICDDDSYLPAISLCRYYKKKGKLDLFRKMCNILLSANEEVGLDVLMDCRVYSVRQENFWSLSPKQMTRFCVCLIILLFMHSYYARVNNVFFTTVYCLAFVSAFYGILWAV